VGGVGPDEALATIVEETAADASVRSGLGVGAHLLERAATLTADERRRVDLLLRAAEGFVRGGEFAQAERVLDALVLGSAVDPRVPAQAVRLRGLLERLRGNLAVSCDLLQSEAERIEAIAPTTAAELYLEAAFSMVLAEPGRALDLTQRAIALDEDAPMAQVLAGSLQLLVGEPGAPTGEEVEAAVRELLASGDPVSIAEHLVYGPAWALLDSGQPERAIRLLDDLIGRLSDARAEGVLPVALGARGQLKFGVGRWAEALREGLEAVHLADAAGLAYEAAGTLAWVALLEASFGLEADCRQHLGRARTDFARCGMDYGPRLDTAARRLELTLDRPERALDYAIDERQQRFAGDWIEAAIRLGRIEDATAALAELEDRHGSNPSVIPTISRLHGLLAHDDDFETWFDRALAPVDTPAHWPVTPFERARTRLLLGERRRRAGRRVEARAPLTEALESFEALGAKHWAERTRRELNATGLHLRVDAPGLDELTPQELTVAQAVAGGATNREVAAAFFLSVKTVEFHLANVYRKLDVRSRSELTLLVGRATAA
jgi:DNA-binding CsgD family transcriptional regulator